MHRLHFMRASKASTRADLVNLIIALAESRNESTFSQMSNTSYNKLVPIDLIRLQTICRQSNRQFKSDSSVRKMIVVTAKFVQTQLKQKSIL